LRFSFFVYWGNDTRKCLSMRTNKHPLIQLSYEINTKQKIATRNKPEKCRRRGINLKGDYVNDTRIQREKTSKYNYVRYFYFFALEIDVLTLCTFRPFSRYYFLLDIYNAANHSNLSCFFHVNTREFQRSFKLHII